MPLIDALLLEPSAFGVWVAVRSDQMRGLGNPSDPLNCTPVLTPAGLLASVSLVSETQSGAEFLVSVSGNGAPFVEGEMIAISNASGSDMGRWNTRFGIYAASGASFKIAFPFPTPALPTGAPSVAKVRFPFDEILAALPAYIPAHLGPGTYETRGYAPAGVGGWQPKSGQKLVGAGIDVTTLRLVGATTPDEHYCAIGMRITAAEGMPLEPLESFEVRDLTIDANVDGQPLRGTIGYPQVACGAVRIMGNHCCVRGIKAIGWGTRSAAQGCFVVSLIAASAEGTDGNGNPDVVSTRHSWIQDCILINPGQNSARETTVLHVGGRKHPTLQAQGFGTGPYIHRNFVDCDFVPAIGEPFSSFIVTAESTSFTPVGGGQVLVTFVGKRPHHRQDGQYVRISNPKFPSNRWNGYFSIRADHPTPPATPDAKKFTFLMPDPGSDDHTLIVAGTEFRALAMTSCEGGVVEENQIHNVWIGGPYQSKLDDTATGDALDPDSALNTWEAIVRNNVYKNVVVGPYWNMGGVSAQAYISLMEYDSETGFVTATTPHDHHLWVGARVRIEDTLDPRYQGTYEVLTASGTTFQYRLSTLSPFPSSNPGHYRVISGVDYLLVEGNLIELADLDGTEFAIKEYPLAAALADQTYRPCGILIGDNGLSQRAGPHAHGQVVLVKNKIYYVDGRKVALQEDSGLGIPVGRALQIAGAKHPQVSHNVIELNPANSLQTFRCGPARFYNNRTPAGVLQPGLNRDTQSRYDELETEAEDVLLLSLFDKRR
jgi:hypothetical protein